MSRRTNEDFASARSVRRWRAAIAAGLAIASAALVPAGSAQAAGGLADLAPVTPAMACAAVTQLDLSNVTDAAVTLTSASVVTSGAAPYCEVRGTIAAANTIVLRLPTQGWTQRYVQTGCGGLCGSANIGYGKGAECVPVKDGTVASATTDMGHQGGGFDAVWATDNPQAQIDFAYRAVHVTSQVAKAVIAKFYGQRPVYSYFIGCSDGGREALMAAQRYPEDFDGIVAGAPANNLIVQNSYHHAWNVLANRDAAGNYLLLAGKLPLLHSAVLNACDALDGAVDGLIGDPRRCRFDPAAIQCTRGQDTSTCLTEAEAGAARRIHDGATDAQGRYLEVPGSHEWGSELLWTLFVPAAQTTTPTFSENAARGFLRYLAYFNIYDPAFQITDLQFSVPAFWQAMQTSVYLAALDPDLRRFARRGGKLLLWHGWNDQHIPPRNTIEYYDAMRRTMGSRGVDHFAKMYLFPGVGHCGGGEGPDSFELLQPVMAWIEGGVEPGEVVASKVTDGSVSRTRPVYPYPTVPRYLGTGSIDDAGSFAPVTPRHDSPAPSRWVGQRLFSSGYQAECQAVGTQLVCSPAGLSFGHGHDRDK